FGMDDIAEHALADFLGVDLGALDRFPDHARRELGGGDVFQAAAIVADGRAHAAQDYHFPLSVHVASPGDWIALRRAPIIQRFQARWARPPAKRPALSSALGVGLA